MCFMFAPVYHSSMKYAAPVRKEMGERTVFNILGPLSIGSSNHRLLGFMTGRTTCKSAWKSWVTVLQFAVQMDLMKLP